MSKTGQRRGLPINPYASFVPYTHKLYVLKLKQRFTEPFASFVPYTHKLCFKTETKVYRALWKNNCKSVHFLLKENIKMGNQGIIM
jgi:hypothetical protein